MTLINFFVRGACVEQQTFTSCFTGDSLTVAELKDLFPFEGVYLFRQKVDARSLSMADAGYVWLDLCDDMQIIKAASESMDVVALAISIPENSESATESSFSQHYEGVAKELALNGMAPRDRPPRQQHDRCANVPDVPADDDSSSAGHIRNLSINNVTKAASSIWSSVVSTATSIHSQVISQSSSLSDASQRVLQFLGSELATPFDDCNPGHMHRLQDIWECAFPDDAFQRESAQWRLLGFQKPDPVLDLKSSGVLPLLNMSYFCQQYTSQAQSMMAAQKENKKSNYPYSIVCINLTLLLADVLGLRDKRYLSDQAPYLELFESEVGFFELFSLCLFHLDFLWTSSNAVRSDFGKIMTELKKLVTAVLKRGPNAIQSLHDAAVSEGMKSLF